MARRENNAILFKNKPLSFRLKRKLNRFERELKAIAIALYWAEGYKSAKSKGIDFANSEIAAVVQTKTSAN